MLVDCVNPAKASLVVDTPESILVLEGINQPLVVHQQTPSALLMKTPQTFEGETVARRTKMKAVGVLFEEKKRSRTQTVDQSIVVMKGFFYLSLQV